MNWLQRRRPTFSIVMPLLNAGATLERALASLVAQSCRDFELIIVDGASTDQSPVLYRRYHELINHLVVDQDTGQSQALNRGFARAQGDWLCWLCGDDEYSANALEVVRSLSRANPAADFIYGACCRVRPDGLRTVVSPPIDAPTRLSYANPLDQPSVFWRRTLHECTGQLDETLHFAMDWDWWCRLRQTGATMVRTAETLSAYHFTGRNKTSTNPGANLRESIDILARHGALGGAVSRVYQYIFDTFDLHGCLDDPPVAPEDLTSEWLKVRSVLSRAFGTELVDAYNLNWISRQMRGLSFV